MEVQNFRPHDKGALKGFFDLRVPTWGDLVIRGMQLFQKDGRNWVNFPSKEFEAEGETKWFPLMRFEKQEVGRQFSDSVVKLALRELNLLEMNKAVPAAGATPAGSEAQNENLPF